MRVRAAWASATSASKRSVGQRRRRIERDLLERALHVAPAAAPARRAARGRGRAPRRAARRPRRSRAADGSRRSPPGCAGRSDRAGRSAVPRPTVSRAGRTAPGGGRTRSCAPRRRHSVDTSRLGPSGSRNRATSVSRRAGDSSSWKTPVASCARWLSAVRSISSVSRCATKTSVFSSRVAPARRLRQQPVEARIAGVHRLRLLAQRASRRVRARRPAPLPTRARGGRGRSSAGARPRRGADAARSTASTASRRSRQLAGCRARSECPPAAAGRRCPRGAWSWCTEAAACRGRGAPRSSRPRETPRDAGAAAAGRTRARRLRAASR